MPLPDSGSHFIAARASSEENGEGASELTKEWLWAWEKRNEPSQGTYPGTRGRLP